MTRLQFASSAGLAALLVTLSSPAFAHFKLLSPPANAPADASGGKGSPPCGPDTAMAATPMAVQGGHMLTIQVEETVFHGGFYRVALAINARTELPVDNTVYDNNNMVLMPGGAGTSDHADFEDPPVFPVLADNLFPHETQGTGMYMQDIMIPNVTCAHCTLQVIEFMHPHGSNGDAGFFYHHCADLAITADPALPAFNPNGAGGAGAGGAAGAGGGAAGGTAGGTGGMSGGGAGGMAMGGSGGGVLGGGTGGMVVAAGGGGTGGQPMAAGGTPTGGVSAGGTPTTAASGAAGASGDATQIAAPSSDSSGGCALVPRAATSPLAWFALLGSALFFASRRRR